MQYRRMERAGLTVSAVGFGAWAVGGSWGTVTDEEAMAALHAALDAGVTFVDTADVYGDGHSERLVARLRRERPDADLVVATKTGRRLDPHLADGYNAANLESFVDRSLANLGVERIDLLQLHCPPTDVYYRPEVFAALDDLVAGGKLAAYGVSVERVEEAEKAILYPGVASVQIIFNLFRTRPADRFLADAAAAGVGVIARVPLASGLLSGKMTATTRFEADDHRNFNRHGEAFDVGETFSGVPFDEGLAAVEEVRPLVPEGWAMAQLALRWILMHDAVSTVIPGAKNREQALANAAAADLDPVPPTTMTALADLYATRIAPHVHHRW
ncbi:MAG: aldo/keto reductase [Acidimicrobiia bacterium]|nr:aldo/keto reductase [Acidimicrobiia bacterium]